METFKLEFNQAEAATILLLMDQGVKAIGLQPLQGDSLLHIHAVQNKIREAASAATEPPKGNGSSKSRKKVEANG